MKPRRWLIRFFTPLVWRFSQRRKVEALQEFALVEKDSGCQILSVMPLIKNPRIQARLFQQVLEEFHHHDLFDEACRGLARAPLGIPVPARDDLIGSSSSEQAVLDFLAYLHVSEREINGDFEAYEKIRIDEQILSAFRAIRRDEMHHEDDSLALLKEIAAGDEGRLGRSLLKAELTRNYRLWLRALRAAGELPLALLLRLIYFLSGPLVFRAFQKRLELAPDKQLGILREQWADSGGKA